MEEGNTFNIIKKRLSQLGGGLAVTVFGMYMLGTAVTNTANPKEVLEFYRYGYTENMKYKAKVESNYKNLFIDAKTFEDSLKVYRENGLPIKLLTPSFQEKERIMEGNQHKKGEE